MREQLKAAINSLTTNNGKSWFESDEFGRIALNAGFELTVRSRLLENLHLEFQKKNPWHSIVSEFSKHDMGTHLRADMALLEGPLSGRHTCEGIFEIKTNFTAQPFGIIKTQLAKDWSKWIRWTSENKKLCLIYIVTEIEHDKSSKIFPKYQNKPTEIAKIKEHFYDFSKKHGVQYENLDKFTAHSSYPGCQTFTIISHILVIEN